MRSLRDLTKLTSRFLLCRWLLLPNVSLGIVTLVSKCPAMTFLTPLLCDTIDGPNTGLSLLGTGTTIRFVVCIVLVVGLLVIAVVVLIVGTVS